MGEIANQLIDDIIFGEYDEWSKPSYKPRGNKKPKGKYRKTASIHLKTPSERKIASIRKEIAILVDKQNVDIQEARKQMNIKYGKSWRKRGLCSNSDDQWTEEDLKDFK